MQETVLVHNRIYSLLETVGRTNPAIDWNTTPSPDYSKLKLGDNVGESASLAITAGRIGDNSRDHDACNGQAPGMESQSMRKPGRVTFRLGSKNQVVYFRCN